MNEPLDLRYDGELVHATLCRPEQLNALNTPLITALADFFEELSARPELRVVVLQAAGRLFCAGVDLKERAPTSLVGPYEGMRRQRMFARVIQAMRRCPQPIITIVHGVAAGGGMALALASDVRLGTPDATLDPAFVRIGLAGTDMGVSYFLPRMVGSSVAAEHLLTGRPITAQRALALGLFSRVGPLDEIRAEAHALAADMLRTSPLGLRLTKESLALTTDAASLEAAMALEDRNQVMCVGTEDFQEAKSAFLEKRRPVWRGR